jgi:hypothetical protein
MILSVLWAQRGKTIYFMCFHHTNIKTKLRVFERKVLRRIYGPPKEKDCTWRIKSNEELNRLTGNKNFINYLKAQRLAWFGHIYHMPDNSMVKEYKSGPLF